VSRTVLLNAVLVDGTGGEPVDGASLVVEDGRIADISRRPVGGADRSIDCAGRTVLPGLIDCHVHIGALEENIIEQQRRYFASELALGMGSVLTQVLCQGFTTVRDAGGADAGFRRAVERGVVVGPRLLVSGRPLSQTGGHGDSRLATEPGGDPPASWPQVGMVKWIADGPDEVRKAVRENLRQGVDQIKVMASGGVMSPTDELTSVQYSLEELQVAVQTAAAAGSYVLAHAYTAAAIRNCVEAGVRSIEHGNFLDADTAALMAERGTFLVPTLVTYEKLYEEGERRGLPKESLEKAAQVYDAGLDGLRQAQQAGVSIASGSDLLGGWAVHKARELEIKAQVLGPMGAIVAATRTSAELLGLGQEVGTLEVGKHADLLVVDGDPLEDLSLLAQPRCLAVIMKGGVTYGDGLGG
jgi:imidazolonepropionase-like amidohydrolase